MLGKKKRNNYEKKLIAGSLAIFIALVSIDPSGVIFAYNESVSAIIDAEFRKELVDDNMGANVTLQIDEKDNQEIVSISMPDGTKIEKEKFEYDENKNIIAKYKATDNGELSYTVSYKEINKEVGATVSEDGENVTPEVASDTTSVVKEEKITYNVSDIKTVNDMRLEFNATDLSSPLGSEIDVMKDIVIKDEDGNDVTSTVNVEVRDYDGFTKDKVGTYKLTYCTMHPVSDEEYTFNRTINIIDTKAKESATKKSRSAKLSNDTSIALSSGNASLKDPSDFRIGKNDQETFNVTVNYTSDAVAKDRELQISIPKGFILEKQITNDQITSAESIATTITDTGETLIRIVLKKNIEITSSFDVFIKQDKKYLYDQANLAKQSYAFRTESYENSGKVDEGQFAISPEKLKNTVTDKLITIDPVDKYELSYESNGYGRGTIGNRDANTLVIKKEAYSDLSIKTLKLPDALENGLRINWYSATKYEVLIGGKVVKTGDNLFPYKTKIDLLKEAPEFMYSYEDTEIRIYGVNLSWSPSNSTYLYDNPKKPFESREEISMEGYQSFGKVSIAAKNTKSSMIESEENTNPFIYYGIARQMKQGETFNNGSSSVNEFIYEDKAVNHGNAVFEYDFPFEIQPTALYSSDTPFGNLYFYKMAYLTLLTNTGRSITIDNSTIKREANKIDFSTKLNSGEYVVKAKVMMPFTGSTRFSWEYKTMTVNKDGDKLGDKETVEVRSKIHVDDTVLYSKNYSVILYKTNKDNIGIVNNFMHEFSKLIGKDNKLGSIWIEQPYDAKDYNEVNLTIKGKELLSLTRSLGFPMGRATFIFSTNKRENVVLNVENANTVDFPLDSDEYLTALEIKLFNLINLYKEFSSSGIRNIYFETGSSKIPKTTPYDGKSINTTYFNYEAIMNVEGRESKAQYSTYTFIETKNPSVLFHALSNGGHESFHRPLMTTSIEADKTSGDLNDIKMDYSDTDKRLLSLIGSFKTNGNTDTYGLMRGTKLKYITNKGEEKFIEIKYTNMEVSYSFNLKKDEYITKLWLESDGFVSIQGVKFSLEFFMRDDYPRTYPIDGTFIGGTGSTGYDSLRTEMKWSAKDVSERRIYGSKKMYGTQKFEIKKLNADEKANVTPSVTSAYQNEKFNVTISDLSFAINEGDKDKNSESAYHRGDENYIRMVNPKVYIVVDQSYSIDPKNINLQGYKADIKFEDSILDDGDSLLTIEFKDYEKLLRSGDNSGNVLSLMKDLVLPVFVKPNSTEGNKTIITGMYYDLDESAQTYKSYIADLSIPNSEKVVSNNGIFNYTKLLYAAFPKAHTHKILPATEMGTASTGQVENGAIGLDVTGYDNETYKQELSIISNANQATYDWKLYIPVPKKGKTVKYIDGGNILESAPADYSFYLSKKVELADKPAGTKIEYTTDADPKYSLTKDDGGSYTDSPSDLKDVTMIRITIPKIDPKQKLFPMITYKVDGSKEKVGKQTAFGANYYNAKIGSSTADYTFGGGQGGYAPLVNFNLTDFEINGTIWEDTEEPQNNKFNDTDMKKENVEVVATSKSGKEYKATTDINGAYGIKVPSSGDTILRVTLPNKKDQIYSFLDQSSEADGSKVDAKGEANVVLKDANIFGMNAGLWANRSVRIDPNSITVRKGFSENVPVTIFPTYASITYLQSDDDTIASVSDKGVVSGKKVGKTKATVSIPDGKGGKKTAEYEIHVVPANAPSATSKSVYMFQGGNFIQYAGIEVFDGDGNAISIGDSTKVTIDSSKVNTDVVGRYPVTYTINDGYQEIIHTRYVYVYGTPELNLPKNIVLKIDTSFNGLDGVRGTYTSVSEDGTIQPNTPISTLTSSSSGRTPSIPSTISVIIDAPVRLPNGAGVLYYTDAYRINVHGYAYIQTAKDDVTVKVGMSFDKIKELVDAKGLLPVKDNELPLAIDWSEFKDFDTTKPGNTLTANISVTDPDTNAIVTKAITITISKDVTIEAPSDVNTVVGKPYDPTANVVIKDGDGNIVPVTLDMVKKNDVDITTPGNYEVVYEYTDGYGNKKTASTTVKVHGKLQFNTGDIHQLQGDATEDVNSDEELSKLAWFIDSNGDKKAARFVSTTSVDSNTVGKTIQTIQFKHPYDTEEQMNRNIYTHGKLEIVKPTAMTVKVNTQVEILKNVSASYQYVNIDGTISVKTVNVTSDLGTKVTSASVALKEIPLKASVEVVSGLINYAATTYEIAFNGMPSITTNNNEITVRVGATDDEIKKLLNASASVHYAKDPKITDLTDKIIWEDLDKVDTSNKKGSYVVTLKVRDADGEEISKTITVNVSDDIIINLPNVDKIIGDSFDPFEGVDIFDGNGNKVDSKDISVDDSKVDMSKPGSYDVEYSYTDEYGNEKKETNTIKVNGNLMFEELDRIDLIEKAGVTYIPTQGKAYYIDYNRKRVDVSGSYDKHVDQGVVNKNTVHFSATHPVDGSSESRNQNIYVHGDLVFKKSDDDKASKVNDVVNLSDRINASYKHVNDDGSIKNVDVKVTDKNVTSDKVGYVNTKANAEVEIVNGLVNKKSTDVKIAFNGLGFINANSSVSFVGATSKKQIINAINATAGMKNAEGFVIDLTSSIDYSDLDSIKLDASGEHLVRITVIDPDGFATYKDVTITIDIPKPVEPEKPINPSDPSNPINPNNPIVPVNPNNPLNPGNEGNGNGTAEDDNQSNEDTNKKEDSITVIAKDIPLDKAKDGISDDLIKSYISVTSKLDGNTDFEILSHNIKKKAGSYKVTIRLSDGSEQTLTINVIDDSKRDVQQPEFGRDDECFIHWIMLLLLLGYSVYSITVIMKRRNEHHKMEKAIEEYAQQRNEGGNEHEN